MMDGHGGGGSFDLSLLIQVLYALAGVAVVVGLLGFIAYRRARRSGQWQRVTSTPPDATRRSGPRRELARLRRRLDQALMTASGAVEVMGGDDAARRQLEPLLGRLEDLGRRLSARLDLLGDRIADDGLDRMLPAMSARVGEVEDLAASLAEAVGTAISGAAEVELREINDELSEALRMVDHRVAALRELSGMRAIGGDAEHRGSSS